MDYVLVDTPPMLPVSDATIISSYVDATLVVTRLGKLTRTNLRELARELDASLAPKLGFILTGSEPQHYYGTYGPEEKTLPGRRNVVRISPERPTEQSVTPIRGSRTQEGAARRWV
jgi:non-specific protein-tyrosine kinase